MSQGDSARQIRVGLFVFGALAVLIAAVFVLGRSQSIFARKVRLYTWFQNTSGLVAGAPVRLAGVDIGIVEAIRLPHDLKEKRVHVTLGVESAYLDRVREDSVARLSSKGLLGDMLIDITVGSADQKALVAGAELRSVETAGMTEVIASVQEAINEVRGLTGKVDERLRTVLTDQLAKDVGRIAYSTANVMEKVEKGSGLVHRVIYDPGMARDAEAVLHDAAAMADAAQRAVARVEKVIGAIESGDGTLHALIYGGEGEKALADAARAAKDLAAVVAELKSGHGLLHSLIYEEDRQNLIQNLTAMSRIAREVAEEVQQGKGTIGALLKDPTAYEDLKEILGNVKRNKLLRALIRYTIKKDDLKDVGKVEDGAAGKTARD